MLKYLPYQFQSRGYPNMARIKANQGSTFDLRQCIHQPAQGLSGSIV